MGLAALRGVPGQRRSPGLTSWGGTRPRRDGRPRERRAPTAAGRPRPRATTRRRAGRDETADGRPRSTTRRTGTAPANAPVPPRTTRFDGAKAVDAVDTAVMERVHRRPRVPDPRRARGGRSSRAGDTVRPLPMSPCPRAR
ncbi:hypothetical protein B4N89_47175 [Embleya scabrispora]|uniref:Uncharacterized protein n=1 Tax=Embleya scabrispora TaxID=159449 RepID=A0A1T3NI24_9ACTN|nr:hypothetical protein B4N89_47175 [Embleya scabrispora]